MSSKTGEDLAKVSIGYTLWQGIHCGMVRVFITDNHSKDVWTCIFFLIELITANVDMNDVFAVGNSLRLKILVVYCFN